MTSALHISATVTGFSIANPSEDSNIRPRYFWLRRADHYRTRLTHTLEVAQISRTISRALRLNEDLTEAIALGHDLGHTPFGHSGERILDELCPYGFAHYLQSVRVVEVLEKDGKGLNLTWEVRDGIMNHRTSGHPSTLEGCVVRLSDKIAYINHDIDDAIPGKDFHRRSASGKVHGCAGAQREGND